MMIMKRSYYFEKQQINQRLEHNGNFVRTVHGAPSRRFGVRQRLTLMIFHNVYAVVEARHAAIRRQTLIPNE